MNGVEPEAMADVMEGIQNDWPYSLWDEFMPWNWKLGAAAGVALAA